MRQFNGLIGVTFLAMTLVHLVGTSVDHIACTAMLAAGGILALSTLISNPSRLLSRTLALSTTVLMFAFFAAFFQLVPSFGAQWYMGAQGIEAVSLLVAAFSMIPVLSCHSCRLKADCVEKPAQERVGFFSVPKNVKQPIV